MKSIHILIIALILSGCALTPANNDLKSPCVANEDPSNPATPCVKRSVNDHWLV